MRAQAKSVAIQGWSSIALCLSLTYDSSVPVLDLSHLVVPDLVVPDLVVPDLVVPDLVVPDLVVPDLVVPDLVA